MFDIETEAITLAGNQTTKTYLPYADAKYMYVFIHVCAKSTCSHDMSQLLAPD